MDSQLLEQLKAPFAPQEVEWKPQATTRDEARCMAVPYVESQPYQERLDAVFPGWEDDYSVWFADPQPAGRGGEKGGTVGKVFIKCRLTVAGVTRTDVGECELNDDNAFTSAKAQAFKRACAAFGLGRYLYDLPKQWVAYDKEHKCIPDAELTKLGNLLRRLGAGPAQQPPATASAAGARPVQSPANVGGHGTQAAASVPPKEAGQGAPAPAASQPAATPKPAPQPAQPDANGRPYNAEQVCEKITKLERWALQHPDKIQVNGRFGAALGCLDDAAGLATGGNHRDVIKALWDIDSASNLSDARKYALVRWTEPAKNEDTKKWFIADEVKTEVSNLLSAHLAEVPF
jgi:hypothetical protein